MTTRDISFICGLHRSGTTYLGKILSHAAGVEVLHEPFNKLYGVAGVPVWYPYLAAENPDSEIETIIDRTIAFQGDWNKPELGVRGKHSLRFRLLGGRQHLQWRMLKFKNALGLLPRQLIWKDPFCTFLSGYLSRTKMLKGVCMIKHPCAHYFSVGKQDWRFDINNLTSQHHLVERHGKGIPDKHWQLAASDNTVSIALLWKLMARYLFTESRGNDRLLLMRHEDFCQRPQDSVQLVCDHLRIAFTEKMQLYVQETSQGLSVDADSGQIHDFFRNSQSLATAWKSRLSENTQKLIMDIVAEDLELFYPRLQEKIS